MKLYEWVIVIGAGGIACFLLACLIGKCLSLTACDEMEERRRLNEARENDSPAWDPLTEWDDVA